jgi:polyisoprenoid-binding protein YceI
MCARTWAALAAVALLAAPALAGTETYTIDSSHSQVAFKVRHLMSKVPGRFNSYSGTITLDRENIKETSISVEIDTSSIDTANEKRDGHLKTADFFDSENHPKMLFQSTSVVPKGKDKAEVHGNLTLLGVTKPVVLEAEILGFGPDAWGGFRSGFEARATVNRKDFGMVWNKILDTGGAILGDEVEIIISLEAIRQAPEKAGEAEG